MNVLLRLAITTLLAVPSGHADESKSIPSRVLELDCSALDDNGECALYDVSMVELIANPASYHGKRVRVIGYVVLQFEGNAIYLSKESHDVAIFKNALWLDPPSNSPAATDPEMYWKPQYAIVEGRFDATDLGHMATYSGAITDTTRLDSRGGPQ